jgi:hypothetical protein
MLKVNSLTAIFFGLETIDFLYVNPVENFILTLQLEKILIAN